MLKIDRYTFKVTLFFTLLCLLLLVIIESFFTFLNELQDLGHDDYGLIQMSLYILFDTPTRVYRIFPMALLLGALLGLGQLASNNELTAIRTAGFSKARTIFGAVIATILMSFLVVILGEYVVPESQIKADSMARKSTLGKGFWAIGDNYMIEVGSIQDHTLNKVNLYKSNPKHQLDHAIKTQKAELVGNDWVIPKAEQLTFHRHNVEKSTLTDVVVPTLIDQTALTALSNSPDNLSARKLWQFITYLDKNHLDSNEYRLAFWSKIFHPLTNISMILIATPLVFAQQRRQGIGERILIGVILGLGIYLATQMLGHFILLSGFAPIIGAIFPTFLAVILAIILFKLLP